MWRVRQAVSEPFRIIYLYIYIEREAALSLDNSISQDSFVISATTMGTPRCEGSGFLEPFLSCKSGSCFGSNGSYFDVYQLLTCFGGVLLLPNCRMDLVIDSAVPDKCLDMVRR